MTAYNYTTQQWEPGTRGDSTQAHQIRETLALLNSPAGDAYAEFIACPSKSEFIAELEADLAMLEDPAPLGTLRAESEPEPDDGQDYGDDLHSYHNPQ